MRPSTFAVLLATLGALGAVTACGDDADPAEETTGDAGPSTTTSGAGADGFCADLAGFYEANGAFFLTVTGGEATIADLDRLGDVAAALPAVAPAAVADDASTVAASIGDLVDALRAVDLADPAAVAPLLLDATDDDAVAAADRLDAYAVDECGIDPEDAATPG